MERAHRGAAPDASGDQFLRVEEHGIEPIPLDERHGRARDLGFLWAGAFVNYASLLTASLATSFFGLGVWDGLAATVLGTVAGALILGLLSHTGPRSGLPQVAFTGRVFGTAGMRIGAFLTLFLAFSIRAQHNPLVLLDWKLSPAAAIGLVATALAVGSFVATAVGTTLRSGAPTPVTFSVAGLPAGASARFDPPTVPAGHGTTLTVSVPAEVKLGSYALVVTAAGTGLAPTVATSLNVLSNTALVTDLSVKDGANAGKWSIQHDLEVGAQVYGDQPATFKIVFDRVIGVDWIRPAAASRALGTSPLVTFTVTTQAEVNVAVDQRAGRPGWLDKSWEDRGTYLVSTDDVTYELFRRTFPAGTVALGPAGGGAQYLIAVQSSTQASIADTAIDKGYDLSHAGPGGGPAN